MSKSRKKSPSPSDYLELAERFNDLAKVCLDKAVEDGKATLDMKLSIGLSLHAAELAGKSMLRSLGLSMKKIRKLTEKGKGSHDVIHLLDSVVDQIEADPSERFMDFHGILCWTPEVNGEPSFTTTGAYLEDHFSKGTTGHPRSYFYPDHPIFLAPVPPEALHAMVHQLIKDAREMAAHAERTAAVQ